MLYRPGVSSIQCQPGLVEHHGPVVRVQPGQDGLTRFPRAWRPTGCSGRGHPPGCLQPAPGGQSIGPYRLSYRASNRVAIRSISDSAKKLFVIIIQFPALVSAFATRLQNVHHPPESVEIELPLDCGASVSAKSDGILPANVISSSDNSVPSSPNSSASTAAIFLRTVSLGGSTLPFSILLR